LGPAQSIDDIWTIDKAARQLAERLAAELII
jgi:hypothetical protein